MSAVHPDPGSAPAARPAEEELLPRWDAEIPLADSSPSPAPDGGEVPMALPVRDEDVPSGAVPVAAPVPAAEPPLPPVLCGFCKAPRVGGSPYCLDCGLMFPSQPEGVESAAAVAGAPMPAERLAQRYQCTELIAARGGVQRFRGLDFQSGPEPQPVVIVRMMLPADKRALATDHSADDQRIGVGDPSPPADPTTGSFTDEMAGLTSHWPGLGWERAILEKVNHSAIPRLLDHFAEGNHYYLVQQAFTGTSLWDAWDDPSISPLQTFQWLVEVAEGLRALHEAGATLEGIRPDIVVITENGHAGITDLSDLLPLPLPANPPLQATPYTAPELVLASEEADGRAALYSFGAMLYALHLGRELTDLDFMRQGVPKPFVPLFPDAHPALARIVMKTFVRDKFLRFPSEEAVADDATGFSELIQALRVAASSLAEPRLDIASWTNTGMARTGNEDAFALLHAVASEQDRLRDEALLILADGMGGNEAGEVASAMAIQWLRERLLKEALFTGLTGHGRPVEAAWSPSDEAQCLRLFGDALKEANRQIFDAARTRSPSGKGRPGMGCTAEVVYIRGRQVLIGHVGDSRTYHYSAGRITLITRDQTLVNRLVELGHLRPDEAESHPRKHELQQALGGQPEVDPMTYQTTLKPGDWLIVCSDGLSNHVDADSLVEMIQECPSAETCARRLVNLANLQGGSDNSTVIAVRAT